MCAMPFYPTDLPPDVQRRALYYSKNRDKIFECDSETLVLAFKGLPQLKDVTGEPGFENLFKSQRETRMKEGAKNGFY